MYEDPRPRQPPPQAVLIAKAHRQSSAPVNQARAMCPAIVNVESEKWAINGEGRIWGDSREWRY